MEGSYVDVRPALVSNGLGIYSGFRQGGGLYIDDEAARHCLRDLVAASVREQGLRDRARFEGKGGDGTIRAYSGDALVYVAKPHEAGGHVGYSGLGEAFGFVDEAFASARDDGHLARIDWSAVPEGNVPGFIGSYCAQLADEAAREAEKEIACEVGDAVGRELDMVADEVCCPGSDRAGRGLGIADTAAMRAGRLLAALGYGSFLNDAEPNEQQVVGGIETGLDEGTDEPARGRGGR